MVGHQKFKSDIDNRTDTIYISSIHPYDETNYHWARQNKDGSWGIYRAGRQCVLIAEKASEEEIAQALLGFDNALGLKRTGGIW